MKRCGVASFFQPKKAKINEPKEGDLRELDKGEKQSEGQEQHTG